jgi:hypothetical protein
MRYILHAPVGVVGLLAATVVLQGQTQEVRALSELQLGARVRLTAPSLPNPKYDAVIGARRGDTLSLVRAGAPTLEVPLAAVTSAEIFRGRSRKTGAWFGLRVGAVVGLIYGAIVAFGPDSAQHAPRGDGEFDCPREAITCETWSDTEGVIYSVIAGVATGALIGAIIGRAKWDRLQTHTQLSFSIVPPSPGERFPTSVRLAARVRY